MAAAKLKCQSVARIPHEIVSIFVPSDETSPVPTTLKVPDSASNDQISVCVPGGRLSMLGKVMGTGVENVTPTG